MIYYGILLFFLLEYVRPGSFIPGLDLIHLNSIVPLAVVVGTMVSQTGLRGAELFKEANTRLILLFLGLIGCSLFVGDVTLYAYNVFVTVFGYVLMYWVLARQIHDLRRVKGVFATLVVIHVILAMLTPQMFTDPDARHYLSSGTFLGDGNDYALSVNLAVPFCLFLMLDAENARRKVLLGGLLLILVLCIVATKSRGGTLALASVGFYYWLKSDRKVLTATLASVAVMVVLLSAPASYFERMGTISSHEDGSSQGRLTAWAAGSRMALDHPLFGVGAGHFPVKFGVEYRPKGAEQMPWLTAHSIFFLVLGELGLPGILTLIFFFVTNFSANHRLQQQLLTRASPQSIRYARLLNSLSASLLAYGVGGAFLSAAYYPHMFVLAGLLVGGRHCAQAALRDSSPAESRSLVPAVSYHPALRAVIPAARQAPT